MKFSLIMATLGRSDEIVTFIKSLLAQTYTNFELLVIDQNQDDRVRNICLRYGDKITIKYIHSARKGLSVNRNIGLDNCSGDIIAFPDDDCEYSGDTLEKARSFFAENPPFSYYTCNVKDKNGKNSIFTGYRSDAEITPRNFMVTTISFTIFVRAGRMASFRFDEQLGVGAEYGSAEEADLILFLLKNNYRGYYRAGDFIYHPNSPRSIETLFSYGKGFGALHKKAVVTYHFYSFLPRFLLVLLKETVKLIFVSPRKERIATIKGRILGFFCYAKNSY